MNTKFLLFTISVATLMSCSSAYKTGQTPDDVYYSPGRTFAETSYKEKRKEQPATTYYQPYDYYTINENRAIRIGINDYRYRYLDYDYNYDYNYNPYNYGYNYGYYYNPHYCTYPVYSYYVAPVPVAPTNTTPRRVNLASYNSGYNTVNVATPTNRYSARAVKVNPATNYNNNNANTRNNNVNYNNDNNNNTRNYTPATNETRSSNSGSSGTSISRPSRRGN